MGHLRRSETETWLMLHFQWVTILLGPSLSARGRRLKGKISEFINIGPARAAVVEEAERKPGGRWSDVEGSTDVYRLQGAPIPTSIAK